MRCVKPLFLEIKGQLQPVPCGQCIACRLNKVRDWTVRIMHESRYHKKNCFLTLTYSPEYQKPSLNKEDLQKFFKRLRKRIGKFRYYACGEYGEEHHLAHFHIILFGVGVDDDIFKGKKYDRKGKGFYQEKNPCWHFGNVYIAELNYATARYVASYVNKKQYGKRFSYELRKIQPEFTVMSRNPGIGMSFVEEFKPMLLRQKKIRFKGNPMALPRYYENKVFDTEELQGMRRAEKLEHQVQDDDMFFSNIQREKNILARVNLKAKRSVNFDKAYEDFKKTDLLAHCSNADN